MSAKVGHECVSVHALSLCVRAERVGQSGTDRCSMFSTTTLQTARNLQPNLQREEEYTVTALVSRGIAQSE